MSVLTVAMTSTTPGAHVWARHGPPVLSHHRACEAVPHVASQPIVRGQLGYLRALGTSGAVPLRSRRPILQTAAPSRRVATQLSRDSRRGSPEPTGNVAHPGALSAQDRDLFPLRKGQEASRSGAKLIGGIPPPSRNQRPPTGGDTPHNTAASSLDSPRAIAFQNRCCSSRPATGSRPGDRIAGRPARSDRLRFRFCIAAPPHRGVATTS